MVKVEKKSRFAEKNDYKLAHEILKDMPKAKKETLKNQSIKRN